MGRSKKHQTAKDRARRRLINIVIILLLIIIIILLLFRSCGGGDVPMNPLGDYVITDTPSQSQDSDDTANAGGTIAFAGFGYYKVSKKFPNIRLENPASNRVEMVFTLIDKKSGRLLARTEKVQPSKYVYINIMDYYSRSGTYDVHIKITTFDPLTGQQKNGMEQVVQIQVT